MSPQPLSSERGFGRAVKNDIIWLGDLALRPHFAALVAEVITVQALVEWELLQLMIEQTVGDPAAMVAVWSELSGSTSQQAMIRAALKHALTDREDYDLFLDVERAIAPARRRRNAFAHHIWAYSERFPDALMLIPPEELGRHNAVNEKGRRAILAWQPTADGVQPLPATEKGLIDSTAVMVYRMGDLAEAVNLIEAAYSLVTDLRRALNPLSDGHEAARLSLLRELASRRDQTPRTPRKLRPRSGRAAPPPQSGSASVDAPSAE